MLAVVSNIIVITDFVNLQYTCLPEAIYSIVLLMMGGSVT